MRSLLWQMHLALVISSAGCLPPTSRGSSSARKPAQERGERANHLSELAACFDAVWPRTYGGKPQLGHAAASAFTPKRTLANPLALSMARHTSSLHHGSRVHLYGITPSLGLPHCLALPSGFSHPRSINQPAWP
ncbi:hypothetical protein F4802DRAFT_455727 [Xylaria palmicola]|nr:hypothetical protein F4802DRAFT_455727 [Xylaria palmicola]